MARPKPRAARPRRALQPPVPAPRRPATPKSQRTQERIVDAAIDSFIAVGHARTSLSSVAERAGLTRTRLQYYFATTEALLAEATQALLGRVWGRYLDRLYAPATFIPDDAFEQLMALRDDREHLAWMELVVASRTDPVLRRIVERAQQDLDRQSLAAQQRLLTPATAADEARLAAIVDLVRFVLEGMTLALIPDDRPRRIERALQALRTMLATYWYPRT